MSCVFSFPYCRCQLDQSVSRSSLFCCSAEDVMKRVLEDRYAQWKSLVPALYDWLTNHHLMWPSLSCRYFSSLSRLRIIWLEFKLGKWRVSCTGHCVIMVLAGSWVALGSFISVLMQLGFLSQMINGSRG